ncbi:hypothetical protein CROQUDRAFT_104586 [Cronartium quercuum f. sp. fusiforme G11]|uniref:Carbonic anhydrase n=1 Tax=Cronartium quercuum f. sp. fusiforme G11 TaxID=708437 RepID=A0A9P6NTS4_9BASI|nr:hypothetical protein CROQUDRAFT_104586 [Cronartium quercuum f. sp. fusiforme G11]
MFMITIHFVADKKRSLERQKLTIINSRDSLNHNAHFALNTDPKIFIESLQGQSPELFWIGCSDSRVPEALLLQSKLGEVLVHRNVANLFTADDTSIVASLAYAINELKVPHLAIVGHENCGGCIAALNAAKEIPQPTFDVGMKAIQKWIEPIRQLAILELKKDPETDLSKVVPENVRAQVDNLIHHPILKTAWAHHQSVSVHGWVYDLANGKILDLNITHTGS